MRRLFSVPGLIICTANCACTANCHVEAVLRPWHPDLSCSANCHVQAVLRPWHPDLSCTANCHVSEASRASSLLVPVMRPQAQATAHPLGGRDLRPLQADPAQGKVLGTHARAPGSPSPSPSSSFIPAACLVPSPAYVPWPAVLSPRMGLWLRCNRWAGMC